MPTKRSCLSRIVLVLVFIFAASASAEESEELISRSIPAESLCLRRCQLRAVKRSSAKVLRLSCYNRCINKNTKGTDQRDLTAQVFKQRIRKALKPVPECGDSSPNQTADWSPSEINVTFGQYDNTSHWYVNISWTPMNDTIGNWTGILVRLVVLSKSLKNSIIPAIPPAICSTHPKNQTFLNINISSYQYSYPDPIFIQVFAVPYSPKHDIAPINSYGPQIPTSAPPTSVQPSTTQSTTPRTTVSREQCYCKRNDCTVAEYGDVEWYPSNVNGRFLNRSNGEWFANISWTPLTNSTITWSGYFLSLFIGDDVSEEKGYGIASCFKLPKYQTSYIIDSSHGWKYKQSICVVVTVYPFPRKTYRDMQCFPPKVVKDPPSIPSPSTTTSRKFDVIPAVFASVAGVCALLIAALVARRCLRRQSVIAVTTQRRFKYHAFIIYSMQDSSDFVDNILVPTLERHHFKYCIHWKDFLPGKVFTNSIVDSVYNSFKIVAVVSKQFLISPPCKFELDQANHRLMNNADDCLILFKYDDVEMPPYLLNRSYIDYTSASDRSTWETKLVDVLKTAEIVEDETFHSEGEATNNNESARNSTNTTDTDGVELVCSCSLSE